MSGEHEIAAGGIAGKGDVLRLQALLEHPGIGGERILQRRRETMLRRQAIVDGEHAKAACIGDPRDQVAMRGDRAETKAAAVEIEDRLVGRRI